MQVNDLNPVTYTYDPASRLRTITQAPLNPVDIQYDTVGRRTRLTLPNAVSTEYQYDAASRLDRPDLPQCPGLLGDLTYTYDPAGNRTGVGGSFARTLLPDPVAAATHDAANRQRTFSDRSMTYDANGSLTSITNLNGVTTFNWDARNRITMLSSPGISASFAYDATSRRAQKTINGNIVRVQYDRANSTREIAAEIKRSATSTAFGPMRHFLGWRQKGASCYLADVLSSTIGLADASGAILTAYTYEPFGRTASVGAPGGNTFQSQVESRKYLASTITAQGTITPFLDGFWQKIQSRLWAEREFLRLRKEQAFELHRPNFGLVSS